MEKCTRVFQQFRQQVTITPFLTLSEGSKGHTISANALEDRVGCVSPEEHNVIAYVYLHLKLMIEITRPVI